MNHNPKAAQRPGSENRNSSRFVAFSASVILCSGFSGPISANAGESKILVETQSQSKSEKKVQAKLDTKSEAKLVTGSESMQALEARILKLMTEFNVASDKWDRDYKAARTQLQKSKLDKSNPDRIYPERFLQIIRVNPSNPATLDACLWILINPVGKEQKDAAIDYVKKYHSRHEKVDMLVGLLPVDVLGEILQNNGNTEVRLRTNLALAKSIYSEKPIEARYILENLMQTGKQVKAWRIDPRAPSVAKRASQILFEMDKLAIGKMAPDIAGEDVFGQKFKLSDYRGKVVVLDFFGAW